MASYDLPFLTDERVETGTGLPAEGGATIPLYWSSEAAPIMNHESVLFHHMFLQWIKNGIEVSHGFNPFLLNVSFWSPWKHQKNKAFPMFLRESKKLGRIGKKSVENILWSIMKWRIFFFWFPWKHQKNKGFPMFSRESKELGRIGKKSVENILWSILKWRKKRLCPGFLIVKTL